MNKVRCLIGFLFFNLVAIAQNEPKEVVEDFFKAFHAQDTTGLQQVCHDNISMQTVTNAVEGTRLKVETAEEFYKSIANIPDTVSFLEKIIDYKVQTDGNMAHVWTPYEFYVNNQLSHVGVNSFTMIKEPDGTWKIVHIIDTRRKN
ncbi:nuclear transport factor 2 family protein [Flavobacterium sp. NRK F10]|uniref:YybH family protein n=1 Tax=Flavobacterium sp. NRK F10 TaxID=2954931 RepID=UPI00209022EB|nr:nuclear transport factor 2 family protein [Flavobacterium sp. NRK F10]MCO6173541.1 nuclear transport factor 2 family protein [Flavobacterium sp. NRK F10]